MERREKFAAMTDEDLQQCSDKGMFLTSEKLLFHYDQVIAIVRQAIAIGEHLSPENRQKLLEMIGPCPEELARQAAEAAKEQH
ncbi:MAG: hypothetical protein EOP49_26080 [Sphingobacteriales bacterium]|nr:MAG: hypothetical protein EOP49_26080 [Sphingobacteriales bacterium]